MPFHFENGNDDDDDDDGGGSGSDKEVKENLEKKSEMKSVSMVNRNGACELKLYASWFYTTSKWRSKYTNKNK